MKVIVPDISGLVRWQRQQAVQAAAAAGPSAGGAGYKILKDSTILCFPEKNPLALMSVISKPAGLTDIGPLASLAK